MRLLFPFDLVRVEQLILTNNIIIITPITTTPPPINNPLPTSN